MANEQRKPKTSARLKGIWGLVEAASVALVVATFYQNVFTKPAVMTPGARNFYLIVTILGITGAVGVVYTQILRYKASHDPKQREKYIQDAPVGTSASVVVVKEDWSPLKKWSILFLIGAVICIAFIAALMLFAK